MSSFVRSLEVVAIGILISCFCIPGLGQTSGRAEVRTGDVRSFGAAGDGVRDDTEAIQAAVDSKVGLVRFPKGTYRISKTIEVDLDLLGFTSFRGDGVAVILMAGPGPAFRFLGTHEKSADPSGFSQNVWERQRMPLVDGVAIQGAHKEAVGIEARGTMQLTVTRSHFRNLRHGIHLAGNNRNVIISDCHIYENHGIGVFYDDVNLHQSNITGSHISYNRGGGIVSRKGNVRNIHVTGCDIEGNMSPDRPQTANILIDSRNSRYGTAEVAITGCTIQHNNQSPDSANIRIIGESLPGGGLSRVREGNITITGNVLSDVKINVHLMSCRGATITGNTFWQGYRHNLLIEDSAYVVVGLNNFDRNPRYNYGNTQDANNSIVIRNSENCTLQGLAVSNVWRDPAAITLTNCRRMHLSNSTILDSDHIGLLLEGVRDSVVSGMLIRDDRTGENKKGEFTAIKVVGGEGNVLQNNILDSPIQVDVEQRHTLRGNTVIRP